MKPRHAAALALVGWYLVVTTVGAGHHWSESDERPHAPRPPKPVWVCDKYATQEACETECPSVVALLNAPHGDYVARHSGWCKEERELKGSEIRFLPHDLSTPKPN